MKRLLFALCILVLAGCGETEISISEVCATKPLICNDLMDDSHCKLERRNVIFSRHDESKVPSDAKKYRLLLDFEKYSKCMELASGIEHIKLKEKTTQRVDSYRVSLAEIKRLSDETMSSDHPGLLYYHWSRHQSKSHLERFLKTAEQSKFSDPDLQFALASHYLAERDPRAIAAMHQTLTLYKAKDRVDPEIYKTLTTAYYKQRKYIESYHWALISQAAGVERIEFQLIIKDLDKQAFDHDKIKTIAEQTLVQIEQGNYQQPKF
jgi:hypothetical protein